MGSKSQAPKHPTYPTLDTLGANLGIGQSASVFRLSPHAGARAYIREAVTIKVSQ